MADFYGLPPWSVVEDYVEGKPRVYIVDANGFLVCHYDLDQMSRDEALEKSERLVSRFNDILSGMELRGAK